MSTYNPTRNELAAERQRDIQRLADVLGVTPNGRGGASYYGSNTHAEVNDVYKGKAMLKLSISVDLAARVLALIVEASH